MSPSQLRRMAGWADLPARAAVCAEQADHGGDASVQEGAELALRRPGCRPCLHGRQRSIASLTCSCLMSG